METERIAILETTMKGVLAEIAEIKDAVDFLSQRATRQDAVNEANRTKVTRRYTLAEKVFGIVVGIGTILGAIHPHW